MKIQNKQKKMTKMKIKTKMKMNMNKFEKNNRNIQEIDSIRIIY